MVKKYQFVKGLATGVLATAATVAGAVFAVKKQLLILKKKKRLSLKKTAKKQRVVVLLVNQIDNNQKS